MSDAVVVGIEIVQSRNRVGDRTLLVRSLQTEMQPVLEALGAGLWAIDEGFD